MKISVVMATDNGERFLREQLDSIRNQTRQADELIICDDGSTDGTVELVRKYIIDNRLENNWKIIVNDQNLGYANNFNKVTLMASGNYIFFADQDDIWMPEKIEKMTKIMEQHTDCKVLCTDYEPMYDGTEPPKATRKVLKRMPNNQLLEKVVLTPKSIYIGALGCCMCVRREFYHQIKKYWFDGWAQDDRMWRLAQCAQGCYILHSNLIKHRIHGNNTSTYGKYHTVEKRVKLFTAMLNANMEMNKMLEDNGAKEEEKAIIVKHIEMMRYRITLLKNKQPALIIPLLRYLKYYQNIKSGMVDILVAIRK